MGFHDRHIWVTEPERLDKFRDALDELLMNFGLHFYLVSMFPEVDRNGLLDNLIVTNWPPGLLERYEATDMFSQSRIVAKLKESVLPVSSEQLLFARAHQERVGSRLVGVFYDDGFACNIGVSLHDAKRQQYLIMLSGSDCSGAQLAKVVFDLMTALDGLTHGSAAAYRLSKRELECLRWSAAGKSSEEIAVILGLSGYTVTGYLKSAITKLGVTTRVQAVALACRLRLI